MNELLGNQLALKLLAKARGTLVTDFPTSRRYTALIDTDGEANIFHVPYDHVIALKASLKFTEKFGWMTDEKNRKKFIEIIAKGI
jgi:hypothetical protein